MVQTEHWSFFLAKKSRGGPQVVLILGLSAGAAAPCLFHAGACGLFLCGLLGKVFCSVFFSSACGFLFTAFSRQLAAIGVLFEVASSGLLERFGSVLQFFAAFFFFSCECRLGAWWCSPFWPLRVLIRLRWLFCSLLSTFAFFSSFLVCLSQCPRLRIFEWVLAFGLQCFHLHVCHVRGVFVCHLLRYFFLFKVL